MAPLHLMNVICSCLLYTSGLWIGNGITEQYQMKANKTTSEMHEDITPEFGYSLIKGKCVKLKLLNNKAEEEEDDE